MPLLPSRRTLRSRWSTLLWAGGVCLFAASFASRDEGVGVDAANVSDSAAAQASALAAEDGD